MLFPPTKDLSILADRVLIKYQSPRFGTCWHGYCCDICDGRRYSKPIYTLPEARQLMRKIVDSDSLALVSIHQPMEVSQ